MRRNNRRKNRRERRRESRQVRVEQRNSRREDRRESRNSEDLSPEETLRQRARYIIAEAQQTEADRRIGRFRQKVDDDQHEKNALLFGLSGRGGNSLENHSNRTSVTPKPIIRRAVLRSYNPDRSFGPAQVLSAGPDIGNNRPQIDSLQDSSRYLMGASSRSSFRNQGRSPYRSSVPTQVPGPGGNAHSNYPRLGRSTHSSGLPNTSVNRSINNVAPSPPTQGGYRDSIPESSYKNQEIVPKTSMNEPPAESTMPDQTTFLDKIYGFGSGLSKSATLGINDEVAAIVESILNGTDYEKELFQNRENEYRLKENAPAAYRAGELTADALLSLAAALGGPVAALGVAAGSPILREFGNEGDHITPGVPRPDRTAIEKIEDGAKKSMVNLIAGGIGQYAKSALPVLKRTALDNPVLTSLLETYSQKEIEDVFKRFEKTLPQPDTEQSSSSPDNNADDFNIYP